MCAQVEAFALNGATAVLGALMVEGCMVAMGQAIIQGALNGTDKAAVMIGVALAAIMLVGIACEGHHNIAPSIGPGRGVHSWAKAATDDWFRNVSAEAAKTAYATYRNEGVEAGMGL